jgi:hypothetical protein
MRVVLVLFVIANVLLLAFGRQWLGIAPPAQTGRDPGRVTQQVRPDAIRLGKPVDVDSVNALAVAATTPPVPAAATPPRPAPTPAPVRPEPANPLVPTAAEANNSPNNNPINLPGTPQVTLAISPPANASCVEWGSFGDTELAQALIWLSARFPQLTVNTRRGEEAQSWMVRIPPLRNAAAAQARAAALRVQGITEVFVFQDPGPNQHALSLGLFRSEDGARRFLEAVQTRGVAGAQIVARSNVRTWLTLRPISAPVRDSLEASRSSFPNNSLRECQA